MAERLSAYEATVRVAEATGKGILHASFPTALLRQRDAPKQGEVNCYVNGEELESFIQSKTDES